MDSGGVFFLIRHTTNEVISGEKVLITFLSNLNRLLLSLSLDTDILARRAYRLGVVTESRMEANMSKAGGFGRTSSSSAVFLFRVGGCGRIASTSVLTSASSSLDESRCLVFFFLSQNICYLGIALIVSYCYLIH